MSESALPFLIPVLFLFSFAGIWLFVVLLLSLLGGWRRLAQKYQSDRQPPPQSTFQSASGTLGFVSYRGVLRIAFDDNGMYLRVLAPFRPGHPHLFIPYHDIRPEGAENILFWKFAKLSLGPRESPTRLRLEASVLTKTRLAVKE